MKLIEDWKKAYRWFSIQLFAVIGAIGLAWPLMPADLKAYLPADILPYLSAAAFLGIIARVVQQGPKDE
jgi:hypothetical protein